MATIRNLAAVAMLGGAALLTASCRPSERASDGRTVITLPTTGGVRNETMWTELIGAFEQAHPDIRVKRLDIPSDSYYVKLQIMIAGGAAPDLAPMMTMRLPMFLHRNAFGPLDDLMAADADFQARRGDLYEKTFEGFGKDGKTYGLAYSQNLYGLYYNKTLFDRYNATAAPADRLEYPRPEWDLAKFLDAARKLTADTDGDGRTDQYGTLTGGTAFYIICPILRRFGVELFNADKTRCNLDTPEAIAAMSWYFDLANRHRVAPSPVGPDGRSAAVVAGGPQEMFMAGTVAMWEAESEWRFEFARRISGFEWDVAEPPRGAHRAAGYECFGMCISASSRHPREAWRFLSFLTSPAGQRIILRHEVGIPVLRSLCESPEGFLNPADPPAHKEAFLKTMVYGQDIPSLPNFQEVESVMTEQLDLARIGKVSTEQACKAAAAAVNALLAENR